MAIAQDIEQFFAEGGLLAQTLARYELRQGQLDLAQAIAQALDKKRSLVAEAGTGTGKTMAYLLPALLSGQKVIVSTATKQLQEQILREDLPGIERALGRSFSVVLMKGRTNYLCEKRAEQVLVQGSLDRREQALFAQVAQWRKRTQTGDRAELTELADNDSSWRQLTATSEQCLGRRCAFLERCWLMRMRKEAEQADLVVINHHLFFADAAIDASGWSVESGDSVRLLPQVSAAIFDEAHELDDIATQHFGCQVNERLLLQLLQDTATHAQDHDDGHLQALCAQSRTDVTALFDALPQSPGRLLLQGEADDPLRPWHQPTLALGGALVQLAEACGSDNTELGTLLARRYLSAGQDLSRATDTSPDPMAMTPAALEANAQAAAPDEQPMVRYSEMVQGQRQIVARPSDISALMHAALGKVPGIFVSATLQVAGSFAHAKARLGAAAADELAVQSPFDYLKQVSLYLPDDLPMPQDPQFAQASAERAAELVTAAGGGAFVLCTSHRALASMYAVLRKRFDGLLLVQGEAPKAHLVASFAHDGNAVLLATMGFWRGVDVPGQALRLVVIDRLPFAVPSDPMVQARMAQLEASGQDPFWHYQVPQAALLLRQGFGRLVRSGRDHGMVAVLDQRLASRQYGRAMLATLPTCPRITDLPTAQRALQELPRV